MQYKKMCEMYKLMYKTMFRAAARAEQEIENGNAVGARLILEAAQLKCETIYVEADFDAPHP